MNRRQLFAALAAGLAFVPVAATPAAAEKARIYTGFLSNAAVGGYDPVAYFREGMPVEGKAAHSMEWMGADWYFASAENLDAFRAAPEKYAPQYGGYCAYGVAQNAAVKGDPMYWTIRDGKLYLNITEDVQRKWEADIPGYIRKAEANWPGVLN
ncbi:YHS domain protein [Maritimibacter sp. 55A14]|uniref:YHS domain-containing (seleno)protein n=1 Tax=Maritimibacter sp. 55A14 TaxID=2174844 RepID=UPI000D61E5D8|nr:YHS domain-containing (seleno)protein [Maritimibacter sp. 55A14]PWE32135.1 YHS domain protein [Maritimibacter sp. 55A14]